MQAEEGPGVAGGFLGELLDGLADGARYRACDMSEECRLVAP
jgi:hypothetical protein